MSLLMVYLVKLYQRLVSPIFPPSCRFYPSCSQYSIEAFEKHGLVRGFWLTAKRIVRCQPLHPGGYDPIP